MCNAGWFLPSGVGQAGRASSVMNVSVIQAVNTAHASYPGSVTVKKAGEDCSVTRVSLDNSLHVLDGYLFLSV